MTDRPAYQLRYRSGDVYEAVQPLQIARSPGGKWLVMEAVGSTHALRPDHHAVVGIAPVGTRVRVERLSRWYEAETDSYNVYAYGRYLDGPAAGQPTGLAGLYDEFNPTRIDGKRTVFFEPDPHALRKVGPAAPAGQLPRRAPPHDPPTHRTGPAASLLSVERGSAPAGR